MRIQSSALALLAALLAAEFATGFLLPSAPATSAPAAAARQQHANKAAAAVAVARWVRMCVCIVTRAQPHLTPPHF